MRVNGTSIININIPTNHVSMAIYHVIGMCKHKGNSSEWLSTWVNSQKGLAIGYPGLTLEACLISQQSMFQCVYHVISMHKQRSSAYPEMPHTLEDIHKKIPN